MRKISYLTVAAALMVAPVMAQDGDDRNYVDREASDRMSEREAKNAIQAVANDKNVRSNERRTGGMTIDKSAVSMREQRNAITAVRNDKNADMSMVIDANGNARPMRDDERTSLRDMEGRYKRIDRNSDNRISRSEAESRPALIAVFTSYDMDGDDMLTENEFNDGLRESVRVRYSREERDSLSDLEGRFSKLDRDGDKMLNRQEAARRGTLDRGFDDFDRNADGKLSEDEYNVGVATYSMPMFTRYERAAMGDMEGRFGRIDRNSDGFIDQDETADRRALNDYFADFDEDNDDRLSETEFNTAVSTSMKNDGDIRSRGSMENRGSMQNRGSMESNKSMNKRAMSNDS